ncbi:MAG: histone deacetylase [Thermodesulfobacteriota bacterium]|nr:histone deacetylase [Thermodesulfobacteriota bacterium]
MADQKHITIITDSSLLEHDTGGGEHPEVPERLEVIKHRLAEGVLAPLLDFQQPQPATREQLLAFHTEAWLFRMEEEVLSGRTYIDHVDNQIGYESFTIAMLSAGTGITGIDLLEANRATNVFCLTRPPGHHAEPNMPLGFCFFNNCVVAARHWQSCGKQRVCVFDFDAHHGNGIQTAFAEDADTLYISIHEDPCFSYPGTGCAEEHGTGEGMDTILNLPLPPGAGDAQVLDLLDDSIQAIVNDFAPQALIIAAGFDAHSSDDMSGLNYSTDLYNQLGRRIKSWEQQFCPGSLLSILEGGYEFEALADSVEAYLTGLLEEP